MEINYLSENIKLYDLSKGLKKTVFMESEHVVSDSRADVAAVLKANAHVTEDEVILDNGLLKLKGKMNIIVCLKSVNGNLFNVQQIMDINEKLDTYENGRDVLPLSRCVIEKVDCRIINERKIGVRVQYDVYVDCNVEKSLDMVSGLESNENAEVKVKDMAVKKFAGNVQKNIEVSDTYLIPNDYPEVFELLYYEAVLRNVDNSMNDNGSMVFKGDVCFRLYYSCGERGENVNYIENNVSFSEAQDIHDMKIDKMFCNVKVANFTMDASQDSDGEYRLVNSNAMVHVTAFCFEDATVQTVEDLYGINKRLRPVSGREAFTYPVNVSKSTCQVSDTMNVGVDQQIAEVIGMDVFAYVTEQVYNNNGVLGVKGIIPVSMLYKDANGEVNAFHHQIPFQYDEKININPDQTAKVWVDQTTAGYNLLSGNEPDVRVNVNLSFRVYGTDTLTYIEDIQESEYGSDTTRASLVLHYCSANDTIWNLSKKYRIRQAVLREINDLDEADLLQDGQQVIIPM
ncbi:MAG TPA: hypothetical protein DDZ89_13230 [Clostridiales bacterium]|nr:hypothetical protein [Clostridiales bacterium]